MRRGFVSICVLLAALLLAGAFGLKHALTPSQPPSNPPALPTADLPPTTIPSAHPLPSRFAPLPQPAVTPEQTQGYIDSETSRLQELSTQNDPASLAAILTDLTNSDKSIRLAAIDAVKQVGSRDAIPALKAAAADNPDTAEQIALLQAADFLQYVPNALTPDQLQAAWQGRNQTPARHHQTAQTQLAQPPPNQPR